MPTNDQLSYAGPNTPPARPRPRVPARLVVLLAILSVPCAGMIWVYDGAVNRFDAIIAVENATPTAVRRVEFYFDGRTIAFDNIAPGATARQAVTLRGSGGMTYAVLPQPAVIPPGTIAPWLDADCKGTRLGLRLRADGSAEEFLP